MNQLLTYAKKRYREVALRTRNFLYSMCPRVKKEGFAYYLSLCVIAKDEGLNIVEWIEYHRMVGVEHFYFYDNGSSDATKDILKPYCEEGIVDYVYFPGPEAQIPAYQDCIDKHMNESYWIAFIDIDEFIVPIATTTIPHFLRGYEGGNGLGINWMNYGSSGYKDRPDGLRIQNFIHRPQETNHENLHIKSIVNPRRVGCAYSPHFFDFKDKKSVLDEDRNMLHVSPYSSINKTRNIRINHYYTCSESEFRLKLARGRADTIQPGTERTWKHFIGGDRNDVIDTIMEKYTKQLTAHVERYKLKLIHRKQSLF